MRGHWLKFPAVRPLFAWIRDTTETGLTAASETVDGAEEEAAPRPGPVLRLKRLLAAPLPLLRLRRPGAETDEAATTAQTPAIAPAWRRLLPYGCVLLAGAVAGGGAGYGLSAHAIARQATALDAQQAEVARLKGLLAGYDTLIQQNRKKLEAERVRRVELENRLAMVQAELRRPPAAGRGKAAPATMPAKAGDCTLRGDSIGDALKGCLSEFNRP